MSRQTEWLNANKYRRYPFLEDCSLVTTGGFELPNSAILDVCIIDYSASHTNHKPELYGIDVVTGSPNSVNFYFWYVGGGGVVDMIVNVPETASFPYTAQCVTADRRVVAVFGEGVLDLLAQPAGGYGVHARLEPSVVSFHNKLRINRIRSAAVGSVWLTGDIYVQEGHNCQVTIQKTAGKIVIAAIEGAGEGVNCEEPGTGDVACGDVLLRINGQRGGSSGEFMLIGANGVSVEPDAANNVIVVKSNINKEDKECGGA